MGLCHPYRCPFAAATVGTARTVSARAMPRRDCPPCRSRELRRDGGASALLASSALSRLFIAPGRDVATRSARRWRDRKPTLSQFVGDTDLTKGWLLNGTHKFILTSFAANSVHARSLERR